MLRFLIAVTIFLPAVLAAFPLSAYAQEEPLIMGVFPRRNFTQTIEMFTPMAKHLSQELGREVKLESTRDFSSFWKAVEQRRYDIVHYNQYQYVKSHKEHGYTVIAKNKEYGRSELAGAICVRKDSGIESLSDLRGKKILFGGGRQAMVSYILTTHLLRKAGLQQGDYQEEFALNPPNAVIATYFGQADAGAAGIFVLKFPVVTQKIDVSKMNHLGVSQPIAHLPWAVKSGVAPALKEKIRALLIGLKQHKNGKNILKRAKLDALLPATDREYDIHRQLIKDVLGEMY